jgi:hypothetical protein
MEASASEELQITPLALDTVNFTDYPKGKAKSGKIDAGREIVNFPTEKHMAEWETSR